MSLGRAANNQKEISKNERVDNNKLFKEFIKLCEPKDLIQNPHVKKIVEALIESIECRSCCPLNYCEVCHSVQEEALKPFEKGDIDV